MNLSSWNLLTQSNEKSFAPSLLIKESPYQRGNMNSERIHNLFQQLKPLTHSYLDSKGTSLQIWKTNEHGMFATAIDLTGKMTIIHKNKIRNPLFNENEDLSSQLENAGLRRWDLVFDNHLSLQYINIYIKLY